MIYVNLGERREPRWVLAWCTIHGSFPVLSHEVGSKCERCRTGRAPTMYPATHAQRSAATILSTIHNRQVSAMTDEIHDGIQDAIRWAESPGES